MELNFDWESGEVEDVETYNVTVRGSSDEWYIDEIEVYYADSNRTHLLTENEADKVIKYLENDNEFIKYVEERMIDHEVCEAEFYRDQEIDRRIDEVLMDKVFEEERQMELDAIDRKRRT
jgi:hypothetical protein